MLCTLDNLKARLGITVAADDDLLNGIIAGVSARMARECGRIAPGNILCLEKATLTRVFDAGIRMSTLWLPGRPIVSVTSIKEGYLGDFTDSDALTAGEDYVVNRPNGSLYRVGCWRSGFQSVEVIYTGGYTTAAAWDDGANYVIGDVVGYLGVVYECITDVIPGIPDPATATEHWQANTTETLLPADLAEAALQQCQYLKQRLKELGASGVSVQGGSVSWASGYGLLKDVAAVCRGYARMMG